MESLKQLIYKKEVDGVSICFEIESNPNRFDFGTYTVEVKAMEFNTFGIQEIPMSQLKDACNLVLKAEKLQDITQAQNKAINKSIAQAINYGKWSSVAQDVANILNATLDYDEIQLIAQECTTQLDGEHLLTTLDYYARNSHSIWKYDNKQNLIRFVTQIFICDWLQSLNGIRRCLGARKNFNEIIPTYDTIENWNFRDALKDGEKLYDINHKGGENDE